MSTAASTHVARNVADKPTAPMGASATFARCAVAPPSARTVCRQARIRVICVLLAFIELNFFLAAAAKKNIHGGKKVILFLGYKFRDSKLQRSGY